MMYHPRKGENTPLGASSRVPGAKLNVVKQSKTETLHVSHSSPSRPSKNASILKSASSVPVSAKVGFATDAKSSTRSKPETRVPTTTATRTVKTTVTTFTTKPRIKPEKPSTPLFSVTNYQKSNHPNTVIKSSPIQSATPSRPSRVLATSKVSARSETSTNSRTAPSAGASSRAADLGQRYKPKANPQNKVAPMPILKRTTATTVKDMSERPIPPECVRCDVCKRGFLPDRLEKHREACRKIESRPKKIFNATAMRTAGTELESYIKRGAHQKEVPVKKSNWRAKHEEFLNNVREAKKVQDHLARGGKLSDLPPPRRSENPDYVQCPHCERKFNESAAERHIPKCANILSNKKKPAAGVKSKR